MERHVAIYVRVSSKQQDQRSQLPDLERWAANQDEMVVWYKDKATGKNMDRPGWQKLQNAINTGLVTRVVCWRLDRLGRTAKGLTALFDDLVRLGVGLYSIKDCLDLSTPAGRLMAGVLASVAAYESEIRGERVLAGQAVARANGVLWGGSRPGRRVKVKPEQEAVIRRMKAEKEPIAAIARATGLSRPTVYRVLAS